MDGENVNDLHGFSITMFLKHTEWLIPTETRVATAIALK